MRVARIGGRRVAYETYGDPRGQPVLIVHGAWGGPSSSLWTGPRLRWSAPTDGLRLIWYDRRCAGLSQYDTQPFALEDLAHDAVDVLDYLQIERAAVIATSAGGPIGMSLALDHADRVSALVLLNTGAALMSLNPTGVNLDDPFVADRLETVARRIALLKLMESEGVEAAIQQSEDEWRTPPEPESADPELAAFRANRLRALSRLSQSELVRLGRGALLNMRAQRGIDLADQLHKINCPTLIVHGDADTTVPIAFGQALSGAILNAQFAVLEDEGHGLIVSPRAQAITSDWLAQSGISTPDQS